jgi:hypothetical protein
MAKALPFEGWIVAEEVIRRGFDPIDPEVVEPWSELADLPLQPGILPQNR